MRLFVSIPYENTIEIGCTASISMIDNEEELCITDEVLNLHFICISLCRNMKN